MAGVSGATEEERADYEWKGFLRPKLEKYSDEANWFYKMSSLRRYPHLTDFGKRTLKELEDGADSLEANTLGSKSAMLEI